MVLTSLAPMPDRPVRRAAARLVQAQTTWATLPSDIAASWRRCLELDLDPQKLSVHVGAVDDGDESLVRSAASVLDSLASDLSGSQVVVVLANANATVLARRADDGPLRDELDAVRLAPGYAYAEAVAGTNGIGTAVAQRRPSIVVGAEHYVEALGKFACTAVPITDPASGRVAGVLALVSFAEDQNGITLALAVRVAREIELRLFDDSGLADRIVLQRFLHERRGAKGPVVIVTERRILANAAADRLVDLEDEPLLRSCAESANGRAHIEVELSCGTTVAIRTEPIVDGAVVRGTILRLRSMDRGRRSLAAVGWRSLSDTERSVTQTIAVGLTNKEAAERLFMSPHTVGFHLRSIYRKLGVNSRVDLTRLALEHQALARSA